jgi:hypothetical protein
MMHDAVGEFLLTASDSSSVCLNCHEAEDRRSYHISTTPSAMPAGSPPVNMTPGGDFGWLKKTFNWSAHGRAFTEEGEDHGHNIVAADFNFVPDSTPTAPGGTFNSNDLSCTSCHDQHGKLRRLEGDVIAPDGAPIIASGSYDDSPVPGPGEAVGVYRLLRGQGSDPGAGGVTYTAPVPAAVAPDTYNRPEDTTDTRVAYGASMSRFCETCHPDMHTDSGLLTHPVDQNLGSTIAGNYNKYVGSADLSGVKDTAYDSLIPFQENNSTDYATLASHANNDGSYTVGAESTDRVSCLSCHKSHASGWLHMTKWNNESELIIVEGEWPGTDAASPEAQDVAMGRTQAETSAAYHDTPASDYATYQRVLCNKCHIKD